MDIKTITIDYRGTSTGSRSDSSAPLHSFECLTGYVDSISIMWTVPFYLRVHITEFLCLFFRFDFIYACPLMREFPVKDFIRVSFGHKVPSAIVTAVLRNGLLCEDPSNSKPEICLYKFFGHSASQLRARSCIMVNYDADFWQETKLSEVEGKGCFIILIFSIFSIISILKFLKFFP